MLPLVARAPAAGFVLSRRSIICSCDKLRAPLSQLRAGGMFGIVGLTSGCSATVGIADSKAGTVMIVEAASEERYAIE